MKTKNDKYIYIYINKEIQIYKFILTKTNIYIYIYCISKKKAHLTLTENSSMLDTQPYHITSLKHQTKSQFAVSIPWNYHRPAMQVCCGAEETAA